MTTKYVVAHKNAQMFWDGVGFTADRKVAREFDFLSIAMLEREVIKNNASTCKLDLVVVPVNEKWREE